MQEEDPFEEDFGNTELIGTKLTLEEIEIALSFLKRRFPRYSIHKIVSTLDHYHYQKSQGNRPKISFVHDKATQGPKLVEQFGSRGKSNNRVKESPQEKKKRDEQNLRLVARLFCEGGDDYGSAKRYMPQLSAISYRNMLLSIANSAIRELFQFLKKECKIELKQLSQSQKISIKTAIINAHEWMGTKSLQAIETLFKFIFNKFNHNRKIITNKEAIELYSVIAGRINHTSLDLLSLEPECEFGEEIQMVSQPQPRQLNSQDEVMKIVGSAFLEECNCQRISNILMKKYGLSKQWQKASVEQCLKRIVEQSLFKLQKSDKKTSAHQRLKANEHLVSKIMKEEHLNLQYALVQLYLSKVQSKSHLNSLLQEVKSLTQQPLHISQLPSSISNEESEQDLSSSRSEAMTVLPSRKLKIHESSALTANRIMQEIFSIDQSLLKSEAIYPKRSSDANKEKNEQEDEDIVYFDD